LQADHGSSSAQQNPTVTGLLVIIGVLNIAFQLFTAKSQY